MLPGTRSIGLRVVGQFGHCHRADEIERRPCHIGRMTTRYCAWIEKQGICRLEDGTYLVRPLGRIPLVYQVSATTKGRFVTIRAASLLIGTIAAVGIFLWPRMPVEMLLNLLTLGARVHARGDGLGTLHLARRSAGTDRPLARP